MGSLRRRRGGIGGVTSTELVARDKELDTLDLLYQHVLAGGLCGALLLGDPGAGKTRLAHELPERYASANCFAARGYPFASTTSFGLWVEALERHLDELKAEEIAAPPQLTPHQRLLVAIAQLLRKLSESAPVIVVLDDLHHADASSWETLAYLARNLNDSRILIVACARTADLQLNALGTQIVLGLEQEGILTRVLVNPLERDSTEALIESRLGRRPPATLVDWLFEQSRGNPFFTIELLRALIDQDVNLATPSLPRLPATIIDHTKGRLEQAPAGARSVLEMLAAAGRAVPLRWLITLIHRTSEALAPDLAELSGRGLIVERLENRVPSFEIADPLVREAVYEGMSLARRQQVHQSLAHFYRMERQPAEAVPHFVRSAAPGDHEAIETLLDALHETEMRQSPYEAMVVLDALLSLLPSGDPRWSNVLDAMVWDADWVLGYNGYISASTAIRALQEIKRALRPADDPLRQAVVNLRLAAFGVWDFSQRDQTTQTCRAALQAFEQAGQQRLALMARHWLAWVAGVSNDLRRMEELARQVVDEAEAQGERGVLEHAHGTLAWCLLREGRFAEADRALERGIELNHQSGNLFRLANDLSTMAFVRALDGRLDEAETFLIQAGSVRPASADPRLLASIKLLTGDVVAAFNALRRELMRPIPRPNALHAWSLVYGTIAASRSGRFDEAQAWLDAAQAYHDNVGFGWEAFFHWSAGVFAMERGEAVESVAEFQDAATAMLAANYLPAAAIVFADLAESAAAANDAGALTESVRQLRNIAGQLAREPYQALATLGAAHLDLFHRHSGASNLANEAAMTFNRLGYRGWEARALELRARALSRWNRQEAANCLQRVIEIASIGGSVRRRQTVIQMLQLLGRPGRRIVLWSQGPSALSRRERQIVDYAVRGFTARQIGHILHISKRTVETHLTNAYAKVGVQSRLELVRRAPQLELT